MSESVTEVDSREGVTLTGLRGWDGWRFRVSWAGAVTVEPPAGERLTAASWRRVPVGRLLAAAQRMRSGEIVPQLASQIAEQITGDPTTSSRRGQRQHLRAVAAVYRFALDQGVSPHDLIETVFDTSAGSATRWIAAARHGPDPALLSRAEEVAAVAARDAATRAGTTSGSRRVRSPKKQQEQPDE